jgi:hypothetical protein
MTRLRDDALGLVGHTLILKTKQPFLEDLAGMSTASAGLDYKRVRVVRILFLRGVRMPLNLVPAGG